MIPGICRLNFIIVYTRQDISLPFKKKILEIGGDQMFVFFNSKILITIGCCIIGYCVSSIVLITAESSFPCAAASQICLTKHTFLKFTRSIWNFHNHIFFLNEYRITNLILGSATIKWEIERIWIIYWQLW